MLLDFSVSVQRNDWPNREAAGWGSQRVEHLLSVIGPIAAYRLDRRLDLSQQGVD